MHVTSRPKRAASRALGVAKVATDATDSGEESPLEDLESATDVAAARTKPSQEKAAGTAGS